MYQRFLKRFLDIVLSACALVIFSPILLLIAILVQIKLGSPVVFCQERPGKDERIFKMYKFRTMTEDQDMEGHLLPDEVRLTDFGKLLRLTSLDELLELFNILRGDMSVVGPRPQLVRDMVFMSPDQRRRHKVRPGLTGWAQVNGRNILCWEDRLRYDLEYIDRISFLEDVKIVLMTVRCLYRHNDVATEGMATSEDLGDYLLRIGKITEDEYREKQDAAKKDLALTP